MKEHGGFEHNSQALRIVDLLESPYPGRRGLNLTYETRSSLLKHGAKSAGSTADDGQLELWRRARAEARRKYPSASERELLRPTIQAEAKRAASCASCSRNCARRRPASGATPVTTSRG
jgi:dGTP triphosphohydrolase